MLTQEENKAIARRFFEEFWNHANESIVDELCAENVHLVAPLVGDFNGRDALKSFIRPLHDAIENLHFQAVRPLVAEGDTVLCCWRGTGVVRKAIGYFPGNGDALDFTGVAIYRINNGLIEEEYTEEDGLKAFSQLGLIT
ncbi:MAG: ester cyclase [Coriobacteriales bacterium]|jgi:predicted ester cyclase|nr:ester cyclase [Coriobacteriales bacterium]